MTSKSTVLASLALVLPLTLTAQGAQSQPTDPPLSDYPPAKRARCSRRPHDRDRDCLGWAVPDYAQLQSGGYVGLVAVGVGYALFDDWLHVGSSYGVSPAFHSGRTVHALHGVFSLRPTSILLAPHYALVPYAGAGFLVTFGEHYFWEQPARYDRYEKPYYPATAHYWTAHLGCELAWQQAANAVVESHGIFWELRTIDRFLFEWLSNTEVIEPWEALSSGLGYRLAF